jgi:type III pantothenate kinase
VILCLDVGNSHIFGGVFAGETLKLRFRHATMPNHTSDQLGVFLKNVLQENGLKGSLVKKIAISSVVPSMDYSLRSGCIKYFKIEPVFITPSIVPDLNINIDNPQELGADLITNAVAAFTEFPGRNIIIINMGTATTFCAISRHREHIGAAILPGMKLSMDALQMNTAKLVAVEILKPRNVIGKNSTESIQSGLYFGQLGAMREMISRMKKECFAASDKAPVVIGTGGFSHIFESEKIFTAVLPDLILHGLKEILVR